MSHTSAIDLIAEATLPCHHQREPFGPCPTCLEDAVEHATSGVMERHEADLMALKNSHAEELSDAEDAATVAENERDDATAALDRLIESVREIRDAVANSTKEYIAQQLDAAADKAELAT